MLEKLKAKLLSAIDDHNEAQKDESKHIDAYDAINSLMECSDLEIENAIADINKQTEELEDE